MGRLIDGFGTFEERLDRNKTEEEKDRFRHKNRDYNMKDKKRERKKMICLQVFL